MQNKRKFTPGDGVLTITGPMREIYGRIVSFNETSEEYLVRFTEKQQMYYPEEHLTLWEQSQRRN